MIEKTDIKSLDLPQLTQFVTETLGEKPFRARQIYDWLPRKGWRTALRLMSNLSASLRKKLADTCTLTVLETVKCYISKTGRHPHNICSGCPTAILLRAFS